MDTTTSVYWTCKDGTPSHLRIHGSKGWGDRDSVPSYGEIGALPIPTTIETRTDEHGATIFTSPPIIGPSHAYRYQLRIPIEGLEAIAAMDMYAAEHEHLRVIHAQSPIAGTDRKNWWSYAHDSFYPDYRIQAPTRLIKTWKRAMLEILLSTHPRKDQRLAEWDARMAMLKDHAARHKTPKHCRAHNDLVVLPYATHFNNGASHQIFLYHVDTASFRKRAKHSLRVGQVEYTIAHGTAATFKDGTAPIEALLPPIQAAMALLAWSRAPMATAHQQMKASARFSTLLANAIAAMDAWLDDPAHMANPQYTRTNVKAAENALRNFLSVRKTNTENPGAQAMTATIEAHSASIQNRLNATLAACQALLKDTENVDT